MLRDTELRLAPRNQLQSSSSFNQYHEDQIPPIYQRLATKEAGRLAQLNVVGILEEPLAAAIACGLDKKEGNILIFSATLLVGQDEDLDVSILSSENSLLRVRSTAVGKGNAILDTVERAMTEARADKSSITDIVMVGDLDAIQEVTEKLLKDFFPGSHLHTSINPREVVATGAAIVAARLTAGNAKVVSEDDGGAVSVQDRGAQDQRDRGTASVQNTQGDKVKQDSLSPSSPPKKKQKLTN